MLCTLDRSQHALKGMRVTSLVLACLVAGCSASLSRTPFNENEALVKGPAVTDLVTPFDRALSCLDGRINKDALRFAVGAVTDATGKEQVTDGGAGKFITQGAGDVVQSALFMAGATVVNRRDPRIIENEAKWGLIDVKKQAATTFFITGSINSLDFLPGGGFDVQMAGLGPRFRQQRILVGLDLSLTDVLSGRIVANVPLQKQVVSTEDGFGIGRFFGKTLVSADFGGKQREALNLVLRQMLNLATFELLTQVMNPAMYIDCMAMVDEVDGVIDNSRSRRRLQEYLAAQVKASEVAAGTAAVPGVRPGPAAVPAATAGSNMARPPAAAPNGSTAAPVAPGSMIAAAPRPVAEGSAPAAVPSLAALADPNASPAAQAPFFSEEQAQIPNAALQALALPTRPVPLNGAESGQAPVGPVGNTARSTPPASNALSNATQATAPTTVRRNAAVIATVAQAAPMPASAGACQLLAGEFPPITPLRASAPGNILLVRSRSAQTLCLANASGRFVPHALAAGDAQRFEGQAPWRLWAERLADLEIVYQGLPLRLPGYLKDRMELLERPLVTSAG